jgi:hypothetical protein
MRGRARATRGAAAPLVAAWMMSACGAESARSDVEDTGVAALADAGPREDARLDGGEREPRDLGAEVSMPPPADVDAGAGTSLIGHQYWSQLRAPQDPFDDRPADAGCNRAGVMPELLAEELVISVDTGACGYITMAQPTLRDIAEGETIKVRLWHFELSAPRPAFAHAAVMVDGLHVLDEQIPIPSPGGLLVRELKAPRAIAAGADVYFHLHNHGANSWSLVDVSAGACSSGACR